MVNNTDDEHAMTLQDIKNALEYYDITADRKSLYDDLNVLRDMGLDILGEQRGRSYYYHVGKKKFELAELKLLVDAIQSSKFIIMWMQFIQQSQPTIRYVFSTSNGI